MKNFTESSIPMNVNQRMGNLNFLWKSELTEFCIKGLLEAFAKFLSVKKFKDKTVSVVLNDFTDNFHFGASVQFIPQEESGADEGSWNLVYTFDPNSIDEKNSTVYHFSDPEVRVLFEDTTFARSGIVWRHQVDAQTNQPSQANSQSIMCLIVDCIKEYMQSNINFDNQMTIPDYMNFTAEVEGNGVFIGCEPSAQLKQYVKEDIMVNYIDDDSEE